jgi:hypothetical protein
MAFRGGGHADSVARRVYAGGRQISIAFGALYLITFATSIPALALYQPVLDDPVGYVANGGSDSQI